MQSVRMTAVGLLLAASVYGCDSGAKPAAEDVAKDGAKAGRTAKSAAKEAGATKKASQAGGDKAGDGKDAAKGKPEAAAVKAAGAAAEGKPVTSPTMQSYPDISNKIADNCSTPHVLMASAPEKVGADYPWSWTRQALLANQQFRVVDGEPSMPGEVTFQLHQASKKHNSAWVLVAKCKDGGTCNKLASMYKGVLKSALAQPVCGRLPMELSGATLKKPVLRKAGFASNTLPKADDGRGLCARLQACSVAMDPPAKAGKETIGFDCQKAPSKFKVQCARKYPCQEVMKCLDAG